MHLALHTGAHYTEQDRLLQSLLRNAETLKGRGVAVPGPAAYRKLVRDTLNAMHRQPAGADAREMLLEAILEDTAVDRVVLSDPNFFRTEATALRDGQLYPDAPIRMRRMADLFPQDQLQIFVAIRNPAGLLPILHKVSSANSDAEFWGGRGPGEVRWSDTLAAIRAAAPEIPITVWCNEDMPLIWAQVIRLIAGLDPEEKIVGGFDLLAAIMSREGMQRFRGYLDAHPDITETQKRKVIAAFLDKFALEEELEEELDMHGWTADLVEELTALYDEDVLRLQRIPGVTLVSP